LVVRWEKAKEMQLVDWMAAKKEVRKDFHLVEYSDK
jgi:hypothetical protein